MTASWMHNRAGVPGALVGSGPDEAVGGTPNEKSMRTHRAGAACAPRRLYPVAARRRLPGAQANHKLHQDRWRDTGLASSRPRHPYGLCPYGGSPYDPASYSACHIAPAIWDGFICSLLCGPLIWAEHIWHSQYGALYGRYHEKAAPMQTSAICANSAAGFAAMLHTNFRTIFCTNKSVQNFICRFLHRPYHIVGHMSKDERENRNSSIRMIHLHKKHI